MYYLTNNLTNKHIEKKFRQELNLGLYLLTSLPSGFKYFWGFTLKLWRSTK